MADLDDPQRLAAIGRAYRNPKSEPVLDALLRRAATIADTPMAMVSVVGAHTQMFIAQHGLPPELAVACGTSRSSSFCQLVVKSERLLVVSDATTDARVPRELVEQFSVRAYAGAPIRRGRFVVGSFCVVDVIPRVFSREVLTSLETFARDVGVYLDGLDGRIAAPRGDVGGRPLRERAESLIAALSVIAPTADLSRGLVMHDITASALVLIRDAVEQALGFHEVVVREVREVEAATASRNGIEDTAMHRAVDRMSRIVDEIAVMARVAEAYAHGELDAPRAARALSVSRDVFDAAKSLRDAAAAFIEPIDVAGGGWS
jgi:hypothetical protein